MINKMMVKIMQRIYLRPLFNKLRRHLDISLPLLVKSGLFEDDDYVTNYHKVKEGKAHWVTKNCAIEILLNEDCIETYVHVNSSGTHNPYKQLICEALQRKLCRYSDGGLHIIYLAEAEAITAFYSREMVEIKCEEITRRFVELDALLKKTATEIRAIYDAFLKIDAQLVRPFIEKIAPSFIPK